MEPELTASGQLITPAALLDHWQAHRRLTRRVIAAFPEDQLFTFSIGALRSFGEMGLELLQLGGPMVKGLATGEWPAWRTSPLQDRVELLELWDQGSQELDDFWPKIAASDFQEVVTAYGQYSAPLIEILLYAIDNEVHHRGQGYVYLRALGVEPPKFFERQ